MNNLNVFSGKNAVVDFLNPDENFPLPLVEIPKSVNPFYDDGVRIYAKLLNMLPLSNLKSLPAFNMVNESAKKGKLEGVNSLVESSSGNTVLSLAVFGRLFGIDKTKAFISYETSPGKLNLLKLFGVDAEIEVEPICPDPLDKESGIYKARKLGEKKGWFNAGQYENLDNPASHKKWTAKQIWEQLGGDLKIFCAGLGTTGTITGCSEFFKEKDKSVKIVGVVRTPNNPVPGVRTKNLLKMISFDWENYVDYIEEVGSMNSFKKSLELIRCGLVVGPSSGFALAGLLKCLKSLKNENKLDDLKNANGEINVVFVCCDSPFPYMNEYFKYLDESCFPKVKNKNLLLENLENEKSVVDNRDYEVSSEEAYGLLYEEDKAELWDLIENSSDVKVKDGVLIIDVRSKPEFEHFHLAGSKNFDFKKLVSGFKNYIQDFEGKKIVVVCNVGVNSGFVTGLLRKEGVDAHSLRGGITEWSDLNFPRWKPDVCFEKKKIL